MPPLITTPLTGRRFVGIARIEPTSAAPTQRFATISEPVAGLSSTLHSWPTGTGGPLATTRTFSWTTELQLLAIGGLPSATAVAGISGAATPSVVLQFINPGSNFASVVAFTLDNPATQFSRVSRVRPLFSPATAPIVVLSDQSQRHIAKLQRFAPGGSSVGFQTFATASLGDAFADDVIELPSPPNAPGRILVTGRASGQPSFAGLIGASFAGLTPRAAWTEFQLGTPGINSAPPGQFVDLVTAGLPTFVSPVRAATDGAQFVYLGGQTSTGTLLIERRPHTNLTQQPTPLESSAAMTLVDMIRGPQGILVLAWVERPLTFAGVSVPYTPTTGINVVVIALHPTNPSRCAPGTCLAIRFPSPSSTLTAPWPSSSTRERTRRSGERRSHELRWGEHARPAGSHASSPGEWGFDEAHAYRSGADRDGPRRMLGATRGRAVPLCSR
jgi:hypothetical protein